MQYPVLYDAIAHHIVHPGALDANKWRQALALPARGNLSKANKDLLTTLQVGILIT